MGHCASEALRVRGVKEVGGAAAVAGAEAWYRGQALLLEGVGDAAFESFVGEGPEDFG